ncbi:hypothetical protein [Halomonas caseinilytica]|uniref:hypothetical protein n=1 Tax=Halomonas caseinilytica TaxID=438744 RepID=UPI0007E5A90A|nr:hypothetical protein [Halomonas caseinilytica]SEN64934.1 hypothetical protein SAMN04487952_1239 [Halomonas caseinilytica]
MIRDKVQSKVAKAFDSKLADAVRPFAGQREVVGEYDPTTGTSTTVVAYSGRGVFGSFRREEIDGQHILSTDEKLTVLQSELTLDSDDSPATPQVDDELDGKTVKSVGQDPASATWTIGLRRT